MEAKILIVDDELAIRNLLVRYLEDAGYQCRAAENAGAAKEMLVTQTFNLLLCDLRMPGDSGLELIRYTKQHYPDMGRVMITGFGSPEIASEIMAVGVYGYIIKPLTRNIVLITVENALRHLRLDLHMRECKVELEKSITSRTEKLAAIMNNLNAGVVMFDADMQIMETNRQMKLWFPGIAPGTTIPSLHAETCLSSAGICKDCPMITTFKTGKTCEATRTIRTEQGERDFRLVTSPILDSTGNIYAGIAFYEDITEKMMMERDLRQAQKFEAVGQLAAGIAHEINTPIQYLGDNLSFLKDSFDGITKVLHTYEQLWQGLMGTVPSELNRTLSDEIAAADLDYLWEEVPKTLGQSLDGVERVKRIVRAMKDLAHPGSDDKTAVDINAILESTITVCRNEWKYIAEMETSFAPDLPPASCFASEIGQVFLNIIVNGAHAIHEFTEGGARGLGRITISTRKAENCIQILITDTGRGIPKEIQDRVFDPFFTTKARGKGTGQGLAIARRVVVDRHQGTLCFQTEKNKGTTFIIEIPAASAEVMSA
ncbi:MAG: response regulator [Desulfocapsaceae bacterium]|nr:response regulator [Desulfocapsaceae bacterium]